MGARSRDKPDGGRDGDLTHRPFAGLDIEGLPEGEEAPADEPPPRVEAPENDTVDDDAAFAAAMAGVAPLDRQRQVVGSVRGERPLLSEADDEQLVMRHLEDLVHGEVPFDFADTDEFIEAAVAGLDSRVRRKLKRGDYSYQAHLDLHGLTRDEARRAVERFVRESQLDGKRCVLLIHGRGKGSKDNIPVLKNKLAAWLTRGSIGRRVLAYASARPHDGGTGAVYVLLRSP